jgi:small subunit ribosomal protein S6
LFLVDSALAASDWEGVLGTIRSILEKAGAEIVSIKKWDECRLAYEIKRVSRGTYILVYFNVEGRRISQIERDVQLSERIMRVLILTTEKMEQQDIDKDTPAERAEKQLSTGRLASEPERIRRSPGRPTAERRRPSEAAEQGQAGTKESVERMEQ